MSFLISGIGNLFGYDDAQNVKKADPIPPKHLTQREQDLYILNQRIQKVHKDYSQSTRKPEKTDFPLKEMYKMYKEIRGIEEYDSDDDVTDPEEKRLRGIRHAEAHMAKIFALPPDVPMDPEADYWISVMLNNMPNNNQAK